MSVKPPRPRRQAPQATILPPSQPYPTDPAFDEPPVVSPRLQSLLIGVALGECMGVLAGLLLGWIFWG